MYDMRATLSAVKPKNFDQIYTLYTRGKVNVEKEYFFPLYKEFMESINASKYNTLSKSTINKFLNL